MSEQSEKFVFTYSAAQQEEIDAIRKKYVAAVEPAPMDKMTELRRLDAIATNKAMRISLTVGILGTLIMGTGMSLIMSDLGAMLDMTSPLLPGVIIGILGMVGVIAAYPLYQTILKKQRAKIAPQILKLAKELSQE